jgi:uncharacterized protein
MKIGLISDTHGFLDEQIFTHFKSVDEIWHAGDIGTLEVAQNLSDFKPFKAVYGNIDGQDIRIRYPEHLRFSCEGLKIWITHIGGYPPRYDTKVKPEIQSNPPDIFITGHSHILKVIKDPKLNLLHMNPGAAGVHGLHKVKTVLRFSLNQGKVKNLEVVELGLRGSI